MAFNDLEERIQKIQERIARAALRAGRAPGDVTLVAVTKGHPASMIEAAYQAGLRDFGENRTPELLDKREALQLEGARWHFIGHLQSRKARDVVGKSDLVHSVDRLSLAQELSKRAVAAGTVIEALIQVNSSGEESKSGWRVATPAEQQTLFQDVERMLALPGLQPRGLMTMAPFYEEAELTRPTFAALCASQQALADRFADQGLSWLSMGMTNDFEVAIEEGATHVRIGTALFGSPGE